MIHYKGDFPFQKKFINGIPSSHIQMLMIHYQVDPKYIYHWPGCPTETSLSFWMRPLVQIHTTTEAINHSQDA